MPAPAGAHTRPAAGQRRHASVEDHPPALDPPGAGQHAGDGSRVDPVLLDEDPRRQRLGRVAVLAGNPELKRAIDDAVPFEMYLDDAHGSPAHRKHLTHYFAEQIRAELTP